MNSSLSSQTKLLITVAFFTGICFYLPGCSPAGMATGAGATAGIAATKEGGLSQSVTDFAIQAQINDLWFKSSVDLFRKLDMTVNHGRVLITGVVQDPQHRVEAVRLAWQPKGVVQVINEIQVANSEGLPGFLRDEWITVQLRTKMTIDRNIQSINYTIDTVQSVVYIMGSSYSQVELNRVIALARTIPNVRQVISYVRITGEEVAPPQPQPQAEFVPQAGAVMDQQAFPTTEAPALPAPVEIVPLDQ